MTPWEEYKRRMSGNNEGGDSTGIGSGTAGSSQSGGSGKRTAWQDYKERMKGEKQKADFKAKIAMIEQKTITLPRLSYPKPVSAPSGTGYFSYPEEEIRSGMQTFEELYRKDKDLFLSGVKDTVAPYYIGAMEEHRASQLPYQRKGYPGLTAKPEPVTDLEAHIEPTKDYYAAVIEYAKNAHPYAERAGKTAQAAEKYADSVGKIHEVWKSRVRIPEEVQAELDLLMGKTHITGKNGGWGGYFGVSEDKLKLLEEELEYAQAIEGEEARKEKLSYNLGTGQKKIEDLTRAIELKKEIEAIAHDVPGEITYEYDKILRTYGLQDGVDLKLLVDNEKAYYAEAEKVHEADKLSQYIREIMSRPDFARKSKYRSTANGEKAYLSPAIGMYTTTGFDDLNYEYINRNPDAVNIRTVNDAGAGLTVAGADYGELQFMQDDEIAVFNYLYQTEGQEVAYEFVKKITSDLNYRERVDYEQRMKKYALEKPGMASIGSVVASPLKMFSYIGQAVDYLTDGEIDQNAGYNKYSYGNTAIRGAISQKIEESGKWGKVGSFLYNTGLSMGDFLMTTAISGGNGKIAMTIMGTGAAADTVVSAKDRGLNDNQAFALGTIAGIAEAVTERYSLEKLLQPDALKDGGLKFVLKNMLAEAGEEAASGVINLFADVMISKSQSEWNQRIRELMNEGKKREEAFGIAFAEQAGSIGLDALGGMLSGFALSGTRVAANSTATFFDERQTNKALELLGKVDDKTDAYAITRALHTVGATVTDGVAENLTAELVEKGKSEADAKALTQAVQKSVEGKRLTSSEKKLLQGDKTTAEVFRTALTQNMSVADTGTAEVKTSTPSKVSSSSSESGIANTAQATVQTVQSADLSTADSKNGSQAESTVEPRVKSVVESQWQPTADGKTHLSESGDTVTIQGVDHVEKGQGKNTVYLTVADDAGNISVVSGEELDYGSREEMLLHEGFGQLGISTEFFPEYMAGYRHQQSMGSDMNAATYVLHFEDAVFYGRHNMREALSRSGLSADARNTAFTAGQESRSQIRAQAQKQNTAVATAKKSSQGKVNKKGKVHYPANMPSKLSKVQEAGVKVAEKLASFGLDVHVYRSTLNEQGQWVNDRGETSPNGYYVPDDGSIHVDLNAGAGGRGLVVYTLAHEITHFIARHNVDGFRTLADLLVEWYEGTGIRVEDLVQDQMDKHGYSREVAFEEVVAHSCESFLTDSDILVKLTELRQKHRKLYTQIRDTVLKFVEWMRKLFRNIDPDSQEGRLLHEAKGTIDHLYEAFTSGMSGAIDTYQWVGAQKNTTDEGGALYSYAGRNAKTADHEALKKAQQMLENGSAMDEIRRETGWHQFKDGKWRFEIDDSQMEFRRDGDARLMEEPGYRRLQDLSERCDSGELTDNEIAEMESLQEEYADRIWDEKYMLRDFIRHDALFEAYPRLNGVSLVFDSLEGGAQGYYSKRSNTIVLSNQLIGSPEETLIHELQHIIQRYEEFATGASPAYWNQRMEEGFTKKWSETGLEMMPTELYRNTAGEIEARDSASRRKLSAEERKKTPPKYGDENTVMVEDESLLGKAYSVGNQGYGGIREALAKIGLDELSEKLGNRFPLSAEFEKTIKSDHTPLGLITIQRNEVSGRGKSAFAAAKNAFRTGHGSKTTVFVEQLKDNVELDVDIAKESISKELGRGNIQGLLDIMPHIGELLEHSVLLNVERIMHTDNKGTVLFGYRMYNLYWYSESDQDRTLCCAIITVVQNTEKAKGYVIQNIENVTIEHGQSKNTGESEPLNDDKYTVSQLYDFVKRIPRSDGGLKYSPDEKSRYLFPYKARNDGSLYSKRNKDSLHSTLMSMEPALVENRGEKKALERYQADAQERNSEVRRQQEMEAELAELEDMESPNRQRVADLKAELLKSYNRTEVLDQRMTAAEKRLKSLAEGNGRLGTTSDKDLLSMSSEQLRERVTQVEEELKASYERQDVLAEQRDHAKEQAHRSKVAKINRTGTYDFVKNLLKTIPGESLSSASVKAKTDELVHIFNKAAEVYSQLGYNATDTYLLLSVEEFARSIVKSGATEDIVADVMQEFKRVVESPRLQTAVDKVVQHYEDILTHQREKLAKQQARAKAREEKIVSTYREAREKSVDGRRKTVIKGKIKHALGELNSLLNHGSKKNNVKSGMKDTATILLDYGEILFSGEGRFHPENMVRKGIQTEVTEKESRLLDEYMDLLRKRDAYQKKIANVKKYRQEGWTSRVAELQNMVDYIDQNKLGKLNKELVDVFERESARINKISCSAVLQSLIDEYKALENAQESYIRGAYNSYVYDRLVAMNDKKAIGETPVKDMSLAQLTELYDAVKMVMTTIKNANKLFREGKAETLADMVDKVQAEIRRHYRKRGDPTARSGRVTDTLQSFVWNELKPFYAFERLGSESFTELFWDVIGAESTYGSDIQSAGEFLESVRKQYGYKDWDMESVRTFRSANEMDFKLTLGDVMSIYAYSRRDQAYKHMTTGGFTFNTGKTETYKDEDGKKRIRLAQTETYRMTDEIIGEIINSLTADQRAYAEAVQDYLTKLGEKGNKVSRTMYGIDLFKEKFYFPLRSDKDYRSSAEAQLNATRTTASLVNTGMAKETVPEASNPIVLQKLDDVAINHIDQMLKYHAYVLPIENLRKVLDYTKISENEWDTSVKKLITAVYGSSAEKYLENWITDLNGAGAIGGAQNPLAQFFSTSKKVSVAGNLSVVAQQYFAITRAATEIDAKYFVPIKRGEGSKSDRNQWEELKQYAPVAVIKEMGGFDMGSSRTAHDYIGKAEAKPTLKEKVDDVVMWGASKMDEIGWSSIWRAVKKEVADKSNLTPGTEEFLQAAGKRFTEVIVKTQVYDSVTSRSGFMRSKHDSVKYLVSFMGEPTTIVNMMFSAQTNLYRAFKTGNATVKKQAVKKMARTSAVLILSSVLTSLAKSLPYAMRDDEETEAFWERYWKQFGAALRDEVNPLGMLPVTRDIMSLIEGWDVERPDVALIQDLIKAFSRAVKGDSPVEDWMGFTLSVFNVLGVPLKNIIRDAKGFIRLYGDLTDGMSSMDNVGAFVRGFTGETRSKKEILYSAIVEGNTALVNKLKASYKGQKEYTQAVRTALRELDPRILEAAMARYEGDVTAYMNIAKEIKAEGNFSQDDIVSAINSMEGSIKKGQSQSSTGEASSPAMYNAEDYMMVAVDQPETAEAVRAYIIQRHMNNGKTKEEADSAFYSAVRKEIRESYELGTYEYDVALDLLVTHGNYSETEAIWVMDRWDYTMLNGSDDGYSKYSDFFDAVNTGKSLTSTVNFYVGNGSSKKTMASQITSHFKPIYIGMSSRERTALKEKLLNAYVALGYDRADKSKDIDKWLEQ